MKTLISLLLLAFSLLLHAQDTSQIPKLKVWFEASGISAVNFLENFDIAGGGKNAIALNRGCGETWYLSPGGVDTMNKFCWGRGYWIAGLDLNGDGVEDYIDDSRNVFQGVVRGAPPLRERMANYADLQIPVPGRGNKFFVGDFNNDSREDIVVPGLYNLAKMLLGDVDLTKMQVLTLPNIANTAYTIQYMVSAWHQPNGENRMILYQQTDTNYRPRSDGFILYSFRILGDSVSYSALDTVKIQTFLDKDTPAYAYSGSTVWTNRQETERTLIAMRSSTRTSWIYEIENDRFVLVNAFKSLGGVAHLLRYATSDTSTTGYLKG